LSFTILSRKNEQITAALKFADGDSPGSGFLGRAGLPSAFPPWRRPIKVNILTTGTLRSAGPRYGAAMIAAFPRRLPHIDGIAPLSYKRRQLSDIPPETAAGDPGGAIVSYDLPGRLAREKIWLDQRGMP
jgi:hypothetical protein